MKKEIIDRLYNELSKELENISENPENTPARVFAGSLAEISKILSQLREMVIKNGFSGNLEEIDFFKNIKPAFYARYILVQEEYHILANVPSGTLKSQREYYEREIEIIERYFSQHAFLYQYYKHAESSKDAEYFLRGNNNEFDLVTGIADRMFSTQADYAFAKFIALETLREKLLRKIDLIDREIRLPEENQFKRRLRWTDSKIRLIELAYGLYLVGSFNRGGASLAEVIMHLEQTFDVNLEDYKRKFVDICRRKIQSQTQFLDDIKKLLEEFILKKEQPFDGKKMGNN